MTDDRFDPGSTIGGYTIEALAGRGGMGLVFRATQSRPQRTVALKVIAPELAHDADFRTRFERESLVAAEIEHPNVIPVYEVGEDAGTLFIAMRFVDGVDLREVRQRTGRVAPERAARMIGQVASALDVAHARGLVHRDIKPGNVLVAGEGASEHVYLTDFGLTRRIVDSLAMTGSGEFVGTLDYMAPEQVLGKRMDARTDIYALGCLLYELLTGAVPFPREADMAKIFAHFHEPAPSMLDRAPGLPPQLDRAVLRALAKDPADRFQSASDFARAVAAGVAGRADTAPEHVVATGDAAPLLDQLTKPAASRPRRIAERARAAGTRRRILRRAWISVAALVLLTAAISGVAAAMIMDGGNDHAGGTSAQKNGRAGAPVTTRTEISTVTMTRTMTSTATPSGGSVATAPPGLTLTAPSGAGFQILVPRGWMLTGAEMAGSTAMYVWTTTNPLDKLQVVLSSCGGCVTGAGGVPDPGAVGLPTGIVSSAKVDRWAVDYRAHASSDTYPDTGTIVVRHDAAKPTGYAQVDLWLPATSHRTASQIIGSFAIH